MKLIEIPLRLRERNQLTLPDRIVERMGLRDGDQLIALFDEAEPNLVRLRGVLRSYKGTAGNSYGADSRGALDYLARERASWNAAQDDPGSASDGTRFLTFAESQRVHRQTDLTRQMYDADPFYRWPRCETCGRFIARMNEHRKRHRDGSLSERGLRTDETQRRRSESRVRKWKAAMATRKRSR